MFRTSKTRVIALLALPLPACGGEGLPEPRATPPTAGAKQSASLPPGSLSRQEVVEVLDEGLGRFLQRVRVEPSIDDGRFVGFKVLELVPETFWRDVDLRSGDVVTHVNEQFLEEPEQAHAAFESLREAKELKVLLIREGQTRQLVYPIVGPPAPAPKPE